MNTQYTPPLKKEVRESKYFNNEKFVFINLWVDLVTYLLILLVACGSAYLYLSLDQILSVAKNVNPYFKFPNYSDLLPSLYYLLLMIIVHEIFRRILASKFEKHLTSRYLQEPDAADLINIYKNKVATNIYKFMFYLTSTIFGYYVLLEYDFFPWSLFGKGEFKNLFSKDYPQILYFEKTEMFQLYYNLNLSFALFDGWILLSNPLQSDFLFMVLHHLSTYSLIIFSFASNYSTIGSIVYFSHYVGDVFSYIVRVVVHLNVPEIIPCISTFVFLVVFSYTRLFVFGDMLYQIYYGLRHTWSAIEIYLVTFLSILMILNIMWIVLITKKFLKYCFTGNIEEIYKFKVNKNKSS